MHKVYEIERVKETGCLRIVKQLDTIHSKKMFRKFCMKNYWHSRKPLRLGFQLEGESKEPCYQVIPHAFSGRPSICFAQFEPEERTKIVAENIAPAGKPTRRGSLETAIQACRRCPLGSYRIQAVPGTGPLSARVMFVDSGPGLKDDVHGNPLSGTAGKLFDKILISIGLSRETVFITNVVKCRPMSDPSQPQALGNDRPPAPEELAACRRFLDEQIRLVRPKCIVTLGSVPTKVLLGSRFEISKVRGRWNTYRVPGKKRLSVRVLPTWHPVVLLRVPELKKDVWTDMKSLREALSSK